MESSTLGGGTATTGHQREGYGEVCARCGARRIDSQIGLESSPDEWAARLVDVFREVRRVLRDDGTLWMEVGDSYSASPPGNKSYLSSGLAGAVEGSRYLDTLAQSVGAKRDTSKIPGLKPKDLIGQPWLLAFALRADGWYLRSCIVWSKPNAMPESVTDRPTTAHSYVFLFSKKPRYFYDAEALREESTGDQNPRHTNGPRPRTDEIRAFDNRVTSSTKNARSVWTIDYDVDETVTWIGKLGSCRKCGGLRIAGNGLDPTTATATGASGDTGNAERTESPTRSSSGESLTDSPSTTSARTPAASTPRTSNPSSSESTSSEAIPLPREMLARPTVQRDTNTLLGTLTAALTESGSAVSVCACDAAPNSPGSVWRVPTEPNALAICRVCDAYWQGGAPREHCGEPVVQHFAAFPRELVRRMILAGTSERGVCAECGAPWVREVETTYTPLGDAVQQNSENRVQSELNRGGGAPQAMTYGRAEKKVTTLGWQPSCECPADSIPATVLDCFAGSGTSLLVARQLGRHAIGVELSERYCAMTRARLAQLSLLAEA